MKGKITIVYLLVKDVLDDIGGQPLHQHHRPIKVWKDNYVILYEEATNQFANSIKYSLN